MMSATAVPVRRCEANNSSSGMDVRLEDGSVVLTLETPGSDTLDQFEVWVDEGLLLLAGPVCRSFVLPPQVDTDRVAARVHDGHVSITLPLNSDEPRSVPVDIETPTGKARRERVFLFGRESNIDNETVARP